jgi:hypothetical protein
MQQFPPGTCAWLAGIFAFRHLVNIGTWTQFYTENSTHVHVGAVYDMSMKPNSNRCNLAAEKLREFLPILCEKARDIAIDS